MRPMAPDLLCAVQLAEQCAERDDDQRKKDDGDDPYGGLL